MSIDTPVSEHTSRRLRYQQRERCQHPRTEDNQGPKGPAKAARLERDPPADERPNASTGVPSREDWPQHLAPSRRDTDISDSTIAYR